VSFRDRPQDDEALKATLRDIEDRLRKIEAGTTLTGRVSFGNTIFLAGGEVQVTVTPRPGHVNGRLVVFTNTLTGATSTITL
jgi:hypothetical protein